MNLITAFEALKSQVESYAAPALDITVASDDTKEDAFLVVREIENLKKSVEQKRKELVAPLNQLVKEINSYAADITKPLLAASTHIRKELVTWEQKLEAIRREAVAKLQKEKDAEELFGQDFVKEKVIAAKEKAIEETRVSGTRKVWSFEITDPNLVPREYCTPDPKLIRAAVALGHLKIPGIHTFEETKITIRT